MRNTRAWRHCPYLGSCYIPWVHWKEPIFIGVRPKFACTASRSRTRSLITYTDNKPSIQSVQLALARAASAFAMSAARCVEMHVPRPAAVHLHAAWLHDVRYEQEEEPPCCCCSCCNDCCGCCRPEPRPGASTDASSNLPCGATCVLWSPKWSDVSRLQSLSRSKFQFLSIFRCTVTCLKKQKLHGLVVDGHSLMVEQIERGLASRFLMAATPDENHQQSSLESSCSSTTGTNTHGHRHLRLPEMQRHFPGAICTRAGMHLSSCPQPISTS